MSDAALDSRRDEDGGASASLDPVVREAQDRLDRCQEWESESRRRFLEDLKFAHGDADNGYQWPNALRHSRDVDQRPCLTLNIVQQHNLQIVNQAKKNKSSIKINGTGGGASEESAKIFRYIIKQIEKQSNAESAYKCARSFQVDGGIGHWRIVTDYADDETFDQEIFIRPVPDPLSVFYDPDAKEANKSDGKFAFVFDILPKKAFREAYPELADLVGEQPLGSSSTGGDWIPKDHLMLCEYFRKITKHDLLIGWIDPQSGERRSLLKSKMPQNLQIKLLSDEQTKVRDVYPERVEWYLIAGEQVIDEAIWPGKYIPLIPCIGTETIIEGILDRKGHTRTMLDAQRMFNYNASAQVEFGALQSKTPYIAPAKAIEEFQGYWNSANQINHSVLPWNHIDDDGNPIPPPTRQEPPTAAPAYESGMQTAFNQMMMVSGQWQNQMGMMGNERTGVAIQERQDQSDTSTFHFQDNFGESLRYSAIQMIDLIPKVYDTRRMKRLTTEDGTELDVLIDPAQAKALQVERNHQNEVINRIFNPSVGKYDVEPDVGPSQGTRREETAKTFELILSQNPGLTGIIGDLMLKNLDFDEAQEAARRMRRMVPKQALGEDPTPQDQQLMQENQQLKAALEKSLQHVASSKLKLQGKDEMRDIDVYKAETERMKALVDALPMDQQGLMGVIDQLVKDTLATHVLPIIAANSGELSDESEGSLKEGSENGGSADESSTAPPIEGSRQAPDGEWYLQDPTRQGKYLRVAPLAQERKPRGVIGNV